MDIKKIALFFGVFLCNFVIFITSMCSMSLLKGETTLTEKVGNEVKTIAEKISLMWVGVVPFIFSLLVLIVLGYYAYLNYDKKD